MYDIITIGSATVDVFIKTESELIKIKTKGGEEDLIAYPTGRKILIEQLDFMTGGGATNTAVSFSRLGLKTGCVSAIGKDDNGNHILDELKKEKIDFCGVIEKKGMTDYSVILDSIEHDRTILAYKAPSNQLKFDKLNKNKLKTRWFYFCTMLGESFKTLEKLALYAEKINAKIAFNPTNYLAKEGPRYLKKILDRTEALVLNREEAKLLMGLNPDESKKGEEKTILKRLIKLGPKIAVMTDGKNGAYCYSSYDKHMYFIFPRNVKVCETTGAGDAFTSSFVAGLVKGQSIEFSLRLAQANAESVIPHYGAKNILLKWREAVRQIKKYKHKVTKQRI